MKKGIAAFLAAVMILSLGACGSQPKDSASGAQAVPSNQSETSTRTITDSVGRKVEIPSKVNKIVPLGNTPRMITYLGLADKVVGIGECEIAKSPIQAYAYVNKALWEKLPNCGTDAMGETAYYPEEIALAAPDVILCTYTADVADDIQKQTGIPTVAVPQGTLFGEDYDQALRMLGDVCGVSGRAEEVISFIKSCRKDLEARTSGVANDTKFSVLGAGATFKGSHSIDGIYTNYPVFKILSANDVAAKLDGQTGSSGVMVDKEQILKWDPDIIFFDAGSMELVRNDYAENPGYFKQLKAVQNGRLYQWPNSTWHWSNVEIPLVSAYYTGALLYPQAFSDVDFTKKAAEIFQFFLGDADYLTKLEEAGAGYGTVTLEK